MGMLGFNFDLTDQLTFYGSYHHNRWNQLLHFFFVPLILWSVAVWACYTGPLPSGPYTPKLPFQPELHIPHFISRYCVPNLAAVLVVAYGAYYIVLEWFAGLTWSLFVALPLYLTANIFYQHVPNAWAWALGAFVLSWYVQIHPGHMVLEKRKPALLDSFFQSLVLAPLFVWLELLFVGGYRRELQAQLQSRIEANIAEHRDGQRTALQKEALLAPGERDGGVPDAAAAAGS
jgi:uncharacterized membrane protein YGL010W